MRPENRVPTLRTAWNGRSRTADDAEREREMDTGISKARGGAAKLAALAVAGALALAASPAALADNRGGPGQPGADDAANNAPFKRKHIPKRFVSWSD
jgi:uncharacterized protein HemX